MPKGPKPERIAGIVAMSYLVLIPVGAAILYQKIRIVDRDIAEIWDQLEMVPRPSRPIVDIEPLKRLVGR